MSEKTIQELLINNKNLEAVLDNFKFGIIVHDLKRTISFFNRAASVITGFDREEVIGNDCHDVFNTPFCGESCNFCNDMITIKDTDEYYVNIITKTGAVKKVEMSITSIKDDSGKMTGVLASFHDITDIFNLKMKAGTLDRFDNIIGRDDSMLHVFQQVKDVAGYDFPVHLFGETGTGKELVANAVHNESRRSGAPFVPINCGALPEGLIESELFGHVKGAFSGAIRDKKGRFELAEGGTIFLDEVAELSKNIQVKLLRFLQEGTFEKVGGENGTSVNVRIISATNKDLKKEVKKGTCREDLYYRLNVIPINLPPLRERKNDVPLLAEYFIQEAVEKYGSSDELQISNAALSMLMDYQWPGNVRELRNTIQFAIVKSSNRGSILPSDLPLEINEKRVEEIRRSETMRTTGKKLDFDSVKAALKTTGGNKAKAAKTLNVGRATLYRFLNDNPDLF